MNQIRLHHVALQYPNENKAEIFFEKVLGLKKEKEFTLFADLGEKIFQVKKGVRVKVYSDNKVRFEIFITPRKPQITYEHICLLVPSKKELLSRCKNYGVKTIFVRKREKEILFIKDFAGYLYEIKE